MNIDKELTAEEVMRLNPRNAITGEPLPAEVRERYQSTAFAGHSAPRPDLCHLRATVARKKVAGRWDAGRKSEK